MVNAPSLEKITELVRLELRATIAAQLQWHTETSEQVLQGFDETGSTSVIVTLSLASRQANC